MKWITREKPKIDRVACPWLIKNFIDKEAEFLFCPTKEVIVKAKELNAIPYDIHGVELTHEGECCSFDMILRKYNIIDSDLEHIAAIVRGADTYRFDLAPQSAGLWAIFAGLSYNSKSDYEMLEIGFKIYDGLYSWSKYLQQEVHQWQEIKNI